MVFKYIMALFRPDPTCALGNLSLCAATHVLNTSGEGRLHPDVYLYGRDEMLVFDRVSDEGPIENHGRLNSFIHLQYPNVGETMRSLMKPTEKLQGLIDEHWETVKDCVAGFHIRRGMYAKDSIKFGFYPFASEEAIEAMIKRAHELDAPVFIMSDSVDTKKYFMSKVPKSMSLELPIGFTACEHSQNVDGLEDEKIDNRMNSAVEWFVLSKMPEVYTTMGGVVGRNVPVGTKEGISSTFGYSAALYGGKIPHYVFNDGVIFYPDGKENSPRLCWSDADTGNYMILREPTKEIIDKLREEYGMWKILVERKTCETQGILEWCRTRVNVRIVEEGENIKANNIIEYKPC
jgi:hypothetical protein